MTGIGPADRRPARRNWLTLVLAGSVLINVFLAGLLGAWLLRPMIGRHFGGPPPTLSVTAEQIAQRAARRLPDADKPILRQAFQNHEQAIWLSLEDWREAQQAARRSLRAEPFDPDAYTAAIVRSLEARQKYNMAIHQAFREAAAAMSREGRARLAMPPSRG